MSRSRLEAFSDAVIAIVMTIMVLELVPPHEASFDNLRELWPIFIAYVLSFAHLAIYWNNHHHLLQAAKTVSGRVLWMNMLLLFWLSLVPFATAIGGALKERISPLIYLLAIPIAFVAPLVSLALYWFVAALWIVPDPRIERRISA